MNISEIHKHVPWCFIDINIEAEMYLLDLLLCCWLYFKKGYSKIGSLFYVFKFQPNIVPLPSSK